jgi:5'-3' exonuclease
MIYRENIWKPLKEDTIIALVDCNVLLHKILREWENTQQILGDSLMETWAKCCWGWLLHNPFEGTPLAELTNVQVILGNDWKYPDGTYWRSQWYGPYKGNRVPESLRPSYQLWLNQLAEDVAKSTEVPIMSAEGFEYDDMAGQYYREHTGDNPLIFITSDQDITQLVDDKWGIQWFNTMAYPPRLRSEYEVLYTNWETNAWLLSSPTDVAERKRVYGDVSDNIAPLEAPIEVIDLINPGKYPEGVTIPEVLPNLSMRVRNSAFQWITSKGAPLP